jgi:broad specificity phosphatase PhoE
MAAASACSGAGSLPGAPGASSSTSADRLIVAVRHAEKIDDSRDPALSPAGAARAAALAALLADANIERVLSSDYVRTRATAAPLASAAGVEVEVYDPRDIPRLALLLLDAPERAILVVGHSNTTPALVAELTGEPADSMPEDEYDRLYRVYVRPDGRVFAEVSRY